MIKAVPSSIQHSLVGVIAEAIPTFINLQWKMITRVVVVAVNVFMQISLFYLHPNLYALGFVFGLIFDKEMNEVVNKVNVIYYSHKTFLEKTLFFVGGGFLALLTMPVSIYLSTLYYSSKLGTLLYENSLNRYNKPSVEDPLSDAVIEKKIANLPDI